MLDRPKFPMTKRRLTEYLNKLREIYERGASAGIITCAVTQPMMDDLERIGREYRWNRSQTIRVLLEEAIAARHFTEPKQETHDNAEQPTEAVNED